MFQFFRDFATEWIAARPLDETRKLNPELQTFETFVLKNRERVLAAMKPVVATT